MCKVQQADAPLHPVVYCYFSLEPIQVNQNPQWGTSGSCSVYTVLNFPGTLSAGAIWQGNCFIAQNTFCCQWRFSLLGLVGCFILVCGTELDVDVKPCSYLSRLGIFILNYRSVTRLKVRHSPNKCLTHSVSHSKTMTKQLNCCPCLIGVFQRMFLFVFFSFFSKLCLTFWHH